MVEPWCNRILALGLAGHLPASAPAPEKARVRNNEPPSPRLPQTSPFQAFLDASPTPRASVRLDSSLPSAPVQDALRPALPPCARLHFVVLLSRRASLQQLSLYDLIYVPSIPALRSPARSLLFLPHSVLSSPRFSQSSSSFSTVPRGPPALTPCTIHTS